MQPKLKGQKYQCCWQWGGVSVKDFMGKGGVWGWDLFRGPRYGSPFLSEGHLACFLVSVTEATTREPAREGSKKWAQRPALRNSFPPRF